MTYDIKEAYNEIMDIAPMYRRDYIIKFLRENLPEEEARQCLFRKTKTEYLKRMMENEFINARDIVEKIGKERVQQYFRIISNLS